MIFLSAILFSFVLQQSHDFNVKNSYYTSWVSPVREGGFGKNIFIEVEDTIFHLDSIAFQRKIEKLSIKQKNETYTLYSVHFNFKEENVSFLGGSNVTKKKDSISKQLFSKWNLEDNEAILFYTYKQQPFTYKVTLTENKEDTLVKPM